MMDKKIFNKVPDVVHNAVMDALDSLEEKSAPVNCVVSISNKSKRKKKGKGVRFSHVAVACVAFLLVSGITVYAMEAVKTYRQRMEDLSEEEQKEIFEISSMGETTELTRPLTEEEQERFDALDEAYEKSNVFPECEILYVDSEDQYSGEGVALDTTKRLIYLPEETLSDEDLLEIIDFFHKEAYSAYTQLEENVANSSDYESRFTDMTDEEVDQVYISMTSNNSEISGDFCRPLTEEEKSRYDELKVKYENEGLYPTSEVTIIREPSDYTGEGVAICISDAVYYFPEGEVTDEVMLEIIEYNHKVNYCMDRINKENELGLRDGYPKLTE
ncbi:MAG: hypothetical protein ACI4DO_06960 [Roseburia sp.]